MGTNLQHWIRTVAGESDQVELGSWATANGLTKEWLDRARKGAKGLTGIDGDWTPMNVTLHSDQESVLAITIACGLKQRELARAKDFEGMRALRGVVKEVGRACKHHRWKEDPSPATIVANTLESMTRLGVAEGPAPEASDDAGTSTPSVKTSGSSRRPSRPSRETRAPKPPSAPKRPVAIGGMQMGKGKPAQWAVLGVLLVAGGINGAMLYMDSRPVPPPDFVAYAAVIPQAESQWMEKDRFILQVNESWAELDPFEREDHLDDLMMATGSLEWRLIEIRAPDGRRYATLNEDWDIIWHGRALEVAEAFASADNVDHEDDGLE